MTSSYVDDQDKAGRFYTQILGFRIKTSAPYGPEERRLSMVAPEEPDGVELVLHLADEPARAFQQASRAAAGRCWSLNLRRLAKTCSGPTRSSSVSPG